MAEFLEREVIALAEREAPRLLPGQLNVMPYIPPDGSGPGIGGPFGETRLLLEFAFGALVVLDSINTVVDSYQLLRKVPVLWRGLVERVFGGSPDDRDFPAMSQRTIELLAVGHAVSQYGLVNPRVSAFTLPGLWREDAIDQSHVVHCTVSSDQGHLIYVVRGNGIVLRHLALSEREVVTLDAPDWFSSLSG